MLENGLEFIDRGLEDFKIASNDQSKQNKLKYSVLFINAGIELILKARLEFEHWSLVLDKNIDKATKDKYETGDLTTVTQAQAIERLKNVCGRT